MVLHEGKDVGKRYVTGAVGIARTDEHFTLRKLWIHRAKWASFEKSSPEFDGLEVLQALSHLKKIDTYLETLLYTPELKVKFMKTIRTIHSIPI